MTLVEIFKNACINNDDDKIRNILNENRICFNDVITIAFDTKNINATKYIIEKYNTFEQYNFYNDSNTYKIIFEINNEMVREYYIYNVYISLDINEQDNFIFYILLNSCYSCNIELLKYVIRFMEKYNYPIYTRGILSINLINPSYFIEFRNIMKYIIYLLKHNKTYNYKDDNYILSYYIGNEYRDYSNDILIEKYVKLEKNEKNKIYIYNNTIYYKGTRFNIIDFNYTIYIIK